MKLWLQVGADKFEETTLQVGDTILVRLRNGSVSMNRGSSKLWFGRRENRQEKWCVKDNASAVTYDYALKVALFIADLAQLICMKERVDEEHALFILR
ncbi:MAG: hypothetical protein HW383_439 [Candidatus Magasanikbacteria bacterium]|nr:hypothetical protein [Candidatus Magasanikbacteria bacterium]